MKKRITKKVIEAEVRNRFCTPVALLPLVWAPAAGGAALAPRGFFFRTEKVVFASRTDIENTSGSISNDAVMLQVSRGFQEYCWRALFRHPSIRRIAELLKAAQKTFEEQGI